MNTIEEHYRIVFTPQGLWNIFSMFCVHRTLKQLDDESWKPRNLGSLVPCSSVLASLLHLEHHSPRASAS